MLQTKFSYSREKKKGVPDIFYYMLFHYWARFKRHVTAVPIDIRFKQGALLDLVSNAEINSYILNTFE